MSTSTEKINKIISQIEAIPEKNLELAKENKKKTTEEIIKIFLNNETESVQTDSTGNLPNLESDMNFYFDMEELQHWKTQMNQTFQIPYYREIPCFRKHFRKIILFIKRGIRKACRFLLEPALTEQSAFNMNTTSAINALTNNEIVTESFIYHEQQRNQEIQRVLEACKDQIAQVNRELNNSKKNFTYESEWNRYKKEIEQLKEQNKELFAVLQNYKRTEKELEELKAQWSVQKTEENVYKGIDYFDFENTFRGERKDIKKELSIYLPYFKQGIVIDLGCGRGEFLELLIENEIEAVGIDNYQEFIDYCRKRGLNVKYGDAMEYLTEMEDNSLGGIFNAQLIEHLESNQLNQFCHLAYQKLKLGAPFVIETPNPMCLSMFTNAFYIDPSHNKPIHPKLLEYLVKKEGFAEVQILFPEYCKNNYRLPLLDCTNSANLKEFNDGIGLLSDILFGSENYAIIARK